MSYTNGWRGEAAALDGFTGGECQGTQRASMKSPLEANEEWTTGVVASKFYSGLDGFRTGISKKNLGWLGERSDIRKAFGSSTQSGW